ncbi:MAG: YceD family protein [Gemmatimonadota bacterium]
MHRGLPTLPLSRDRLREGPVRLESELGLESDFGPVGFALDGSPEVSITAEESHDGRVRIRGSMTARLSETCSRCLTVVERERHVPLDFRFEPGLDPWDEGPGVYALNANQDELDVGPALREELLLALPDYPLCRSECRGLCPQCGTDLNEGDCECVEPTGDSRWDALRAQLAPDGLAVNDDERQDG